MPGWDGPGFNPLDAAPPAASSGPFTFGDIGACACGCACFGCSLPQISLVGSFANTTFSETGSGTITFLGSNTTLVWGDGVTSNAGCCWQGMFFTNRGNRVGFRLVCTASCTAAELLYGSYSGYVSVALCDDPSNSSGSSLIVNSASCSPLSIAMQVFGHTYFFTLSL